MRVAFFDIAGTITRREPWSHMVRHAHIDRGQVRGVYPRIFPYWAGKRLRLLDDVTFRDRWVREMARFLVGWSRAEVDALNAWTVRQMLDGGEFHAAVVLRVRQHLADAERVVLVSGIFDLMAETFAAEVGAHAAIGSRLDFKDRQCTGKIAGETCAGERKLAMLRAYLRHNGLDEDLSQHYAYADSMSDLPMLAAVGTPTAVYPSAALRAEASRRGWAILGDLPAGDP